MATTKRTYGDRCGVARALDIVGERWALLVVRELLLGPKRFTDLRAGLPHVSPDVLAQRLRELEAAGVVRRGTLPPPAGSRIYELTERGRQLEPVVLALGRWGSVGALPAGEAQIGVDAARHRAEDAVRPGGRRRPDASYELRLGEQHFRLRVADGRLDVARGERPRPRRASSRPTRRRWPPSCGTAATPTRRAAPAIWPSAATRGGRAPARAVPAALLTLQSCRRARRHARQSA